MCRCRCHGRFSPPAPWTGARPVGCSGSGAAGGCRWHVAAGGPLGGRPAGEEGFPRTAPPAAVMIPLATVARSCSESQQQTRSVRASPSPPPLAPIRLPPSRLPHCPRPRPHPPSLPPLPPHRRFHSRPVCCAFRPAIAAWPPLAAVGGPRRRLGAAATGSLPPSLPGSRRRGGGASARASGPVARTRPLHLLRSPLAAHRQGEPPLLPPPPPSRLASRHQRGRLLLRHHPDALGEMGWRWAGRRGCARHLRPDAAGHVPAGSSTRSPAAPAPGHVVSVDADDGAARPCAGRSRSGGGGGKDARNDSQRARLGGGLAAANTRLRRPPFAPPLATHLGPPAGATPVRTRKSPPKRASSPPFV